MYGAIFGDIIGSRFEFDRGGKTKKFKLFTEQDNFTDDTAMTVAVADGLMKAGKNASVEEIYQAVTESMRIWANKYPDAGYGGRFYRWLFSGRTPVPYGSYGNGSAMRVSAAGWLYDSLERTREVAKATAEVTHNHPEGIKGAECTAAVIYLGRTRATKEEIKAYVVEEFGYDISHTVDELRPLHEHVESCQDSLPKALVSFFEGESYEDVVRNAVSLGGDTDTLGAIAGSMAEAFYGIPVGIVAKGQTYLPEDMLEVIHSFNILLGRSSNEEKDDYKGNECIKQAIDACYQKFDYENFSHLLFCLVTRIKENGEAPMPMVDVNHVLDSLNPDNMNIGDEFSFDQDLHLVMDTMRDGEGNEWFPLFTDEEERAKGQTANFILNVPIQVILENGLQYEKVQGVVINPFGKHIQLPKDMLEIILQNREEASGNATENAN